ncbi:1963_t:CDS:10 [Acaulospora morrowiae]|uniref:1963_t:CDS:1 n=1 Tax=Acaulospora morrowiae TaxID=94023 RepID=A0A9N9AXQ6_9GLOM|nr:1963_t:CDS:10 [Acaulospora morrowiae]
MKVFKSTTRTAVTEWIERMTSDQYQEEDLSDMFQLCEAVTLQETGPKEASKALRRVFKYGNTHSHLRGLTVLQTLVENCGENFQAQINSQKFVDRLRILANSPNTDPRVHKKLMTLLAQWSNDFANQSRMYAISHLHDSLTSRRGGSFSSTRRDSEPKPVTQSSSSTSSNPSPKEKRKNVKSSKTESPNAKPQTYSSDKINEEIGLATQNATNLINALTLLGPKTDAKNDFELQELVQKCKSSSEQLVKIISTVTEGSKLGPLLQSNDQVQGALSIYSDFESGNSGISDDRISSITRKTEDNAKAKRSTTKIRRETDDLIDFDTSNSSANNGIVPDNSLLDDPFADPVTPPRTPEPEPGLRFDLKG